MKIKFDHSKNDFIEAINLNDEQVFKICTYIAGNLEEWHDMGLKQSEVIEKIVNKFDGAELIIAVGILGSLTTIFDPEKLGIDQSVN